MSGKRRKYTPEFREAGCPPGDSRPAGRWLMSRPRSVLVNKCWGVGCASNAEPYRLVILARC